jgi:hypothetical protein
MSSNVIPFPPQRPPFLEISADHVDGYKFVIRYRDERYRQNPIWRGKTHKATVAAAAEYAPAFQVPVVDMSARRGGC